MPERRRRGRAGRRGREALARPGVRGRPREDPRVRRRARLPMRRSTAITRPPGRPGSAPPSRRRPSPPSMSPGRWPRPCSLPSPGSSTPSSAWRATGSCSDGNASGGTSRSARATASAPSPTLVDADDRDGARYRTFESESVNQRGELVLQGRYEGVVPALERRRSEKPRAEAPSKGAEAPDAAGDVAPDGLDAGDRWPPLRFTPDRYAAAPLCGRLRSTSRPSTSTPSWPGRSGCRGSSSTASTPTASSPAACSSLSRATRAPCAPRGPLPPPRRPRARSSPSPGRSMTAAADRIEVACTVSQDGREVLSEGIAELAPIRSRRG